MDRSRRGHELIKMCGTHYIISLKFTCCPLWSSPLVRPVFAETSADRTMRMSWPAMPLPSPQFRKKTGFFFRALFLEGFFGIFSQNPENLEGGFLFGPFPKWDFYFFKTVFKKRIFPKKPKNT